MYLYRNNHDGTLAMSPRQPISPKMYSAWARISEILIMMDILICTLELAIPLLLSGTKINYFVTMAKEVWWCNRICKGLATCKRAWNSFCDLDNDGDQDIFIVMGGAYPGDAAHNSFYLNPGQNDNHWINVHLEGAQTTNRPLAQG